MDDGSTSETWLSIDTSVDDADGVAKPVKPSEFLVAIRIVLALAAFFAIYSVLEYRRTQAFAATAVTTTGTVTQKWVSTRYAFGRRASYRRRTRYNIRYEFHDAAGVKYRYRESLWKERWDGLAVGAPVTVWYVPSEPANHALFERRRTPMEGLLAFASVIFIAVSGWYYFEFLATRPRRSSLIPDLKNRMSERRRRFKELRRPPSIYRPMT